MIVEIFNAVERQKYKADIDVVETAKTEGYRYSCYRDCRERDRRYRGGCNILNKSREL